MEDAILYKGKMTVKLVNTKANLLSNREVGPNLYLMKLYSPYIASRIKPGQFVHMKLPGMEAHILRRPFSVYACDRAAGTLEILYHVVGFGSAHMADLTPEVSISQAIELIGPVGTTWGYEGARRALLVGGGVGAAPLYMLCEQLVEHGVPTDVILGAQTKQALTCKERYEQLLGNPPRCATDDGSFGHEGFCTSLVSQALSDTQVTYDYVAVCGPWPLMRSVAALSACVKVYCEASLEARMACGIGACLSCVVETVEGKKRACVDGPVFDTQKVIW